MPKKLKYSYKELIKDLDILYKQIEESKKIIEDLKKRG